ncbi:regulatory protein RecX [Rheinheimera gaetbuli]
MHTELATLQQRALAWLSRRDYSEAQLRQRLLRQGGDSADIEQVMLWCKAQGYLDQQRFIDMLLRSRINKGYGLNYIVQECRAQQISRQHVLQSEAAVQTDWFHLALQVYRKKYADNDIADYRERQKRMAYLQRRGFSNEQIQFALEQTT